MQQHILVFLTLIEHFFSAMRQKMTRARTSRPAQPSAPAAPKSQPAPTRAATFPSFVIPEPPRLRLEAPPPSMPLVEAVLSALPALPPAAEPPEPEMAVNSQLYDEFFSAYNISLERKPSLAFLKHGKEVTHDSGYLSMDDDDAGRGLIPVPSSVVWQEREADEVVKWLELSN